MTVTLNLPPQVEQALSCRSAGSWIATGRCDSRGIGRGATSAGASELNTEEWLRRFKAWTASHADITVVLPDEAMERESIYADRGL
jgi:hypothetical protein